MAGKPEANEKADMLARELERMYPGRVEVAELLKSAFEVRVKFPFESERLKP